MAETTETVDQSVVKPHKTRRKRPSGKDLPDSSLTPDPSTIPDLPAPQAKNTHDPELFFSFWNKLDREFPNRTFVYVYRFFPIIDRERLGKDKNVAKISRCTGPNKMNFYSKMGCGDYQLYLNDGLKRNRNICSLILVEGFRDYDNYPPVMEMEDLVLEDPGNKQYIERMRMKGVSFPGLDGEDDSFMMNQPNQPSGAAALSTLAQTVERLSLSQMNQPRPPSLDGEVSARTMDSLSKSVEMSNKILGSAYEKAANIKVTQADPMEMTNAVIKAAQAMQPAATNQPQLDITGLLNVFQSMGASQIAAITKASEDRVAGMKDSMDQVIRLYEAQTKAHLEVPVVDPLKNLKDTLSIISDVKAVTGGGESNPENPWVSLAQAALAGLPSLITLASTVVASLSTNRYNDAVARTGQGQPLPPPQPTPSPETPGVGSQAEAYQKFLQQIAAPLLNHLANEDLDGVDFARWLTDSQPNGRLVYDQLREQGAEKIVQMIQESHPPLYAELQKIPVKFREFLTEFLEYDIRVKDNGSAKEDD